MCPRTLIPLMIIMALAVGLPAFSMVEQRFIRPPTPPTLQSTRNIMSPPVLSSGADTLWVQVHNDSSHCPGDPLMGHGGEATGGPGPMETWCFEGGPGDSCGTNPPWDVNCFSHEDVRAKPSAMDINYWHVDTYRADQRAYCGNYALWCGSDLMWEGNPVECATWQHPPGYGNGWNCIIELTLPDTFDIAAGCTLLFDPRYDTECKYDYFYVDFWDGSEWKTLATFNTTSNNPGPECGGSTGGNPDYYGNTDIDRLTNVDWQERADPSWPAFAAEIDSSLYSYDWGPRFRWRFVSDHAWSDADSPGNTDGGAWIDNVCVLGDDERYEEDFESGTLDTTCWSLTDPDGVTDQWHIVHDPDPPYEGGDGGYPTGCNRDSSHVYRARPEGGYAAGAEWRNGWCYRLMTPSIPVTNSGCVVQYDEYQCYRSVTCDYPDQRVRFFDSEYGQWCPWIDVDWELYGPICGQWFNTDIDVTDFMSDRYDSMQFAWHLVDTSLPHWVCRGKHVNTDYQIDNVSVGFYDVEASLFRTRPLDLLHDTFFTGLCGYNSGFHAYDDDTLAYYWHEAHGMPLQNRLCVHVRDNDEITSVELLGSIDDGASWQTVTMAIDYWNNDPYHPHVEGDCYGTLCPSDFGAADWDTGATVWYYVKATDDLSNVSYYPTAADPGSPDHTGKASDYFTFSVLPLYPHDYDGARILLVNGFSSLPHAWAYYWAECLANVDSRKPLVDIYEQTLTDAGYCYDIYDIGGATTTMGIHPVWFDDYDAVVWFTGGYHTRNLINPPAQYAIRDYLEAGGKVILCGDRLAYSMAPCEQPGFGCGEDSLDGYFLAGIMGCDYLSEMDTPFNKPYVYCESAESLTVFGSPLPVDFNSILVYRECPYLRDMSWVKTETEPPMGYTAQPLLEVLNPDVALAHNAIYVEYMTAGQCVFMNFDLSASVNHERAYCSSPDPAAPPYGPGVYEGRVDLMSLILEDIFGLTPSGGGTAGTWEPARPDYGWALAQNTPNPCVSTTHIRFELPHRAEVNISVYDALGRVVRVLVDEIMEPGEHTVPWDGRNTSGRRISSGIYFYRMHSEGFSATRKMLVVN